MFVLSCPVNLAPQPRTLPARCCLTFSATFPSNAHYPRSNSFVCHSYAKHPGYTQTIPNPGIAAVSKGSAMKSATLNVTPAQTLHCAFRTPSGRFCRLPIAEPNSSLCYRHAFDEKKQASADLLQRLTTDCDEFTTAVGIHNSLSELYKLLAADLITARRAAVLAYIANLLLRTIPIAQKEVHPGEQPRVIVDCDFPRSKRDDRLQVTPLPSEPLHS